METKLNCAGDTVTHNRDLEALHRISTLLQWGLLFRVCSLFVHLQHSALAIMSKNRRKAICRSINHDLLSIHSLQGL